MRPAGLFDPVGLPSLHRGDDARAKLAKTRAALKEANRRITGGANWYDSVRASYRKDIAQ